MLFNSYIFIFAFLPATLLFFYALQQKHLRWGLGWLILASLFYYGWARPQYIFLILSSIAVNYFFSIVIARTHHYKRIVLALGLFLNVGLLGFLKYGSFVVRNFNALTGVALPEPSFLLPLAISFFTFQQIAFLVDTFRRQTSPCRFIDYCLFITFFPHLLSGPIVRCHETLPQFTEKDSRGFKHENLAVGMTLFTLGLFKKVLIADSLARNATPVFLAVAQGAHLSFFEAWAGVLAYTFQIYFDFSGYSDMAIGVARMFGVLLPLNFHSPYKARNLIDFWKRWHMTLSRFLRDYVYIPLGGNRKGRERQYLNIMITMLLCGLWHGAGWTFVVWGGLHGFFLVINHGWLLCKEKLITPRRTGCLWNEAFARLITFLSVAVAWVFFRAEDMDSAFAMLYALTGAHGVVLPQSWLQPLGNVAPVFAWLNIQFLETEYLSNGEYLYLLVLLGAVWFLPNTQEMLRQAKPALDVHRYVAVRGSGRLERFFQWKPTVVWVTALSILVLAALLSLQQQSEFIYFQF